MLSLFINKLLLPVTLREIIVIILVVGLYGCGTGAGNVAEEDPESLRSEFAATQVAVAVAEKKPFVYYIQTNGKVVSGNEMHIPYRTSGMLSQVRVYPGDWVNKGEILAMIDNSDQKLQLEKAIIALKERELEYRSQLLGLGARADSVNIDALKTNLRYLSGLAAAEVALEEAKLEYNKTILKAPMTGIVSDVQVQPGNPAKSGEVFCIVYDPASMRIETEILESDLGKIRAGMKAVATPVAVNGSYEAVVERINPRIGEHGTVKITLTLKNAKGLVPGMNTGVMILVPYKENVIIPRSAVLIRSGKEVVFVEDNGLAKWHYVTTGLENGEEIEIIDGLEPGVRVITENNLQLAHDAPVVVVEKDERE